MKKLQLSSSGTLLSAECLSSFRISSTLLISCLQWLIHFHLHLVSPVLSFSKHTDSLLGNRPCVHSHLYLCRWFCSYNWIHTERTLSPHSRTTLLFCYCLLPIHTALRRTDPLIETWTANSGPALFVVCALSARNELNMLKVLDFTWTLHLCLRVCMFWPVVTPGWRWFSCGSEYWLACLEVLTCVHLAPCHCLDWDLHHGTTRLKGLAANTWSLEESKP